MNDDLFLRGVYALEQIAAELKALGQLTDAAPVHDIPAGCQHTEEKRIDMGPDEWICHECKYHHNAEQEPVAP